MKIRFLRDCQAKQEQTRFCCEGCGNVPSSARVEEFLKDDEADPEQIFHKIDLSELQYKVDYEILEYP
jgi:hypothetical protein